MCLLFLYVIRLSERGGCVSFLFLPFCLSLSLSLWFIHTRRKECRFSVISTPYVMNFQIPLSHKIESIKSPMHHLPPTFLTPDLSSLEFYHFAQSESSFFQPWVRTVILSMGVIQIKKKWLYFYLKWPQILLVYFPFLHIENKWVKILYVCAIWEIRKGICTLLWQI